jgi:hypothetical protein
LQRGVLDHHRAPGLASSTHPAAPSRATLLLLPLCRREEVLGVLESDFRSSSRFWPRFRTTSCAWSQRGWLEVARQRSPAEAIAAGGLPGRALRGLSAHSSCRRQSPEAQQPAEQRSGCNLALAARAAARRRGTPAAGARLVITALLRRTSRRVAERAAFFSAGPQDSDGVLLRPGFAARPTIPGGGPSTRRLLVIIIATSFDAAQSQYAREDARRERASCFSGARAIINALGTASTRSPASSVRTAMPPSRSRSSARIAA